MDDGLFSHIIMSLVGKKILVVGGNGYVGNYFAARLIRQGASVMAISRKGLQYNYPENAQIDWLIGDILSPHKFLTQINAADTVVHTVGTLFDSSVTRGTAPGGPGTYEQVNRDTFASLLSHLQSPKRVVYLSSNAHPPFLPRYLSTKHEAEQLLFASPHDGYSLRPGFIYSSEHRWWSVPVRHSITAWRKAYPFVHGLVPPQGCLQRSLQQFKQGENTSLDELGDALVELCVEGGKKRILETGDIHDLSVQARKKKPSA